MSEKVGLDWKLVVYNRGPLKGQYYARNPKTGGLVRVTERDIEKAQAGLGQIINPYEPSKN